MDEAAPFDEAVLSRLAGGDVVEVDRLRREGRSRVSRFGTARGTVIAKRLADVEAYANEVATLRLLERTGAAPRLLACDDATSTFVMDDLGSPPTTADAYQQGTAAEAAQSLMATSTALAAMHVATFGREAGWHAARPQAPPASRFPHDETLNIDGFVAALSSVGCEPEPAAMAEMRAVEAALADPGPFLALTHGDPCPDNVLLVDGRAVVIDYEFAAFRHVLLDAVYPRMVFPTCWCANRVHPALVGEFEARYRADVAGRCPAAEDDGVWERAIAVGCAGRLIGSLGWLLPGAVEENRVWGIATVRQRFVPRLLAFMEAPGAAREFPALTGLAEYAIECLHQRWTPAENELPAFAPFREAR